VKTGIRGLGFVRTKGDVEWPADLQVKLPKPPADKTTAPAADSTAPQATAPATKTPDNSAAETKTPDTK
jgi:HlyD family secretion protein